MDETLRQYRCRGTPARCGVELSLLVFEGERARNGFTLVELAKRAKINRLTLNRLRRGHRVRRDVAIRIARALGVPLRSLLAGGGAGMGRNPGELTSAYFDCYAE